MSGATKKIWKICTAGVRRGEHLFYGVFAYPFQVFCYPRDFCWEDDAAILRFLKSIGTSPAEVNRSLLLDGLISCVDRTITFYPPATPKLISQIDADLSRGDNEWSDTKWFGSFRLFVCDEAVPRIIWNQNPSHSLS